LRFLAIIYTDKNKQTNNQTMKHKYEIGQRVVYRGDFGMGRREEVVIIGMGEKNDRPVYDLDNGHWCYENQIEKVRK